MASFGLCYLALLILAGRGGLGEEIGEDGRPYWAWEAEGPAGGPWDIKPRGLIQQVQAASHRAMFLFTFASMTLVQSTISTHLDHGNISWYFPTSCPGPLNTLADTGIALKHQSAYVNSL